MESRTLYQVVVLAILLARPGSDPVTLKPQFHADDEEDAVDQAKTFLNEQGYEPASGAEFVVSEVPIAEEPESEESAARRLAEPAAVVDASAEAGVEIEMLPPEVPAPAREMLPPDHKRPTLEEYVAGGYQANTYERAMAEWENRIVVKRAAEDETRRRAAEQEMQRQAEADRAAAAARQAEADKVELAALKDTGSGGDSDGEKTAGG